jgi:hypothetical protein
MSEQRRERKQQRDDAETGSGGMWRRIALIAALLVVVAGTAYFFVHRTEHKYDDFARCLGERGVKMYGAYWCPHCQEQKEKFGASFEYAPYIECGVKGNLHAEAQVCKDQDIKHFPTWQFPPTGERQEKVFSLESLSERTGCPLP